MKNRYRNILILAFSMLSVSVMAQVKIGANPTVITANAKLEVEGSTGKKVTVMDNGNVGIGTTAPSNPLHISATADPIKVVGLQSGASSDNFVSVDANGVFRTLSATKPQTVAIKLGSGGASTARGSVGGSYHFPNYVAVANTIPGATIAANGDITVSAGTYQVTVTIDASVSGDVSAPGAGFYMHSYFYDFPTSAGNSRIHQNTVSNLGGASNHGVSITYTTSVTASTTFPFNIGWGQGGNAGTSCNLGFANGCQMSITKIL